MGPLSRVGECLRSTREHLGWSREALAYRSGLSWTAIAQIESGRRQEVRLSTLLALADALGVSVDYLARGGAGAPPKLLRHSVLIYGTDEEYVTTGAAFLLEGVARGERVLAVTGRRQIGLLRDALGNDAPSVDFHDSAEWYRSPIGAIDNYRTHLEDVSGGDALWARALGEPVWAGRSTIELAEWARYESMINLALAATPATVMCPYDARAVPDSVLAGARQTHPELAEGAGTSELATYLQPEEFLLPSP